MACRLVALLVAALGLVGARREDAMMDRASFVTLTERIARESDPLVLTVPMPPTNTNSGKGRSRHWRVLEREKKFYWDILDLFVELKRIPEAPSTPIARATIRSTMHLGAAMDDDNAMARHKWPIDWLRTRGYIGGDRRTNLRWESLPEQIVKRDGNYRIVLTLTPLGAPSTEEG